MNINNQNEETTMSFILSVLLFFLLYSVGVALWRFYTVYRKVREATRQFRDFSGTRNSSAYGNGAKQDNANRRDTYGGSNNSNSSYGSGSGRRTTTTPSGDVVEDRRSEYEINRKIFTKEEGEYIDFEEQ